jgi:sugar phosphate isomerase/epimerase
MAKIGVQAMMLKKEVEEDGAFATLKRVSELGFNAVEISQIPMTPENVAEIDRARTELGMEIASLSATVDSQPGGANDSLVTDFDKVVADCKTLGATIVRIGMLPFDAMASLEAVLEFCRTADELAVRLAEHGIGLYYHNHHVEFTKYDGRYLLDLIRENAPHLRFEIDVHWVQRGGLHPQSVLKEYAGLVDLVHLKDYRIGKMPPAAFEALGKGDYPAFMAAFTGVVEFGEVGEGNLDWKGVIDQALESGAKYLLIEQDDQYGRDPFDCLATSHENLVALGYSHLF